MAKKPFPFSVCEECCNTGGGDSGGIGQEELDKKVDKWTPKDGVLENFDTLLLRAPSGKYKPIGTYFTPNVGFLVQYNENQNIYISPPKDSLEAATKQYVDDMFEKVVAGGGALRTDFDLSSVALYDGFINGGNGQLIEHTSYKGTDYIAISGFDGAILTVTSLINASCGFSFYDKNKAFLSGVDGYIGEFTPSTKKQTVQWSIPEGAYYVRFTLIGTDDISNYPMSAQIDNVAETIHCITNNAISEGKSRSVDLSNVSVNDEYIHGETGKSYATETYGATDFISIPGTEGATITFCSILSGNAGWSFYDRNKKFIYGMSGNSEGVTGNSTKIQRVSCIVPENTHYIRFTMRPDDVLSNYPMSLEYVNLGAFAGSISKVCGNDALGTWETVADITIPEGFSSYSYAITTATYPDMEKIKDFYIEMSVPKQSEVISGALQVQAKGGISGTVTIARFETWNNANYDLKGFVFSKDYSVRRHNQYYGFSANTTQNLQNHSLLNGANIGAFKELIFALSDTSKILPEGMKIKIVGCKR